MILKIDNFKMKKNIHVKINEFLDKSEYQSLDDDELLEMANLWGKHTGLDDIVIWIGSSARSKHGKRIKVSNINSKIGSSLDCFTITIPELKIIGDVNIKHVTKQKLDKIFDFINLNIDAISDVCDEKIDTVEFILRMKKI